MFLIAGTTSAIFMKLSVIFIKNVPKSRHYFSHILENYSYSIFIKMPLIAFILIKCP